jgi:hypothetical protein
LHVLSSITRNVKKANASLPIYDGESHPQLLQVVFWAPPQNRELVLDSLNNPGNLVLAIENWRRSAAARNISEKG